MLLTKLRAMPLKSLIIIVRVTRERPTPNAKTKSLISTYKTEPSRVQATSRARISKGYTQ